MTEKEYEIFEADKWPHKRFQCECGKVMGTDTMTECKRCGAFYEHRPERDVMFQIAPPVAEFSNDDEPS